MIGKFDRYFFSQQECTTASYHPKFFWRYFCGKHINKVINLRIRVRKSLFVSMETFPRPTIISRCIAVANYNYNNGSNQNQPNMTIRILPHWECRLHRELCTQPSLAFNTCLHARSSMSFSQTIVFLSIFLSFYLFFSISPIILSFIVLPLGTSSPLRSPLTPSWREAWA